MSKDAADALRKAASDEQTVGDAWRDQQLVNESISVSSTDLLARVLSEESHYEELSDVVARVAEGHFKTSDV